jgi:hypothetical protein
MVPSVMVAAGSTLANSIWRRRLETPARVLGGIVLRLGTIQQHVPTLLVAPAFKEQPTQQLGIARFLAWSKIRLPVVIYSPALVASPMDKEFKGIAASPRIARKPAPSGH